MTAVLTETELRERIRRAFPADSPPTGEVADTGGCSPMMSELFSGRDWRELDDATLDEHWSRLSLFTLTAQHYFLPAFLTRGLDPKSPVSEGVIYNLCPDDNSWWDSRFSSFSPEQLRVCAKWLECVIGRDPDPDTIGEAGLERYWKRYLDSA